MESFSKNESFLIRFGGFLSNFPKIRTKIGQKMTCPKNKKSIEINPNQSKSIQNCPFLPFGIFGGIDFIFQIHIIMPASKRSV